jgi:hypothetical protein
MSKSDTTPADRDRPTVYREYLLNVRIVESQSETGDPVYRFDAPNHGGSIFNDPETAELYADVYFDVNGFEEAGTGERGVPPTIIQAGRDTLVAYLLTQPHTDVYWLASFYGEKPEKIQRYVNRVRKRATKIRDGARDHGLE